MSALPLKEYQRESLDAIGRFCDAVRQAVARKAMRPAGDEVFGALQHHVWADSV